MRKQIVAVTPNQMKIVVDKNSDPRNVQLFKNLRLDDYEEEEDETGQEDAE